ncbi:hypothetical protein J31TS4_44570 [Paenibacillus sp. J31TS4]|uniref:hypothetical protein n=1 Tax=Paenibacillus sp. J31TS4 TaxID=2807195 RepID=UPI001B1150EA|nr:hypothetical protein [Paenibacillus sp. J31TS4]GIP41177.1 hypothetical protein J31TS4_44570 [Paenibacillus sp. J31TS4]
MLDKKEQEKSRTAKRPALFFACQDGRQDWTDSYVERVISRLEDEGVSVLRAADMLEVYTPEQLRRGTGAYHEAIYGISFIRQTDLLAGAATTSGIPVTPIHRRHDVSGRREANHHPLRRLVREAILAEVGRAAPNPV